MIPMAITLLGIWVVLMLWVVVFPPMEKPPPDDPRIGTLEPTRMATKRLRDGTRITIRVYRSTDTGRTYRRTTTTRPE